MKIDAITTQNAMLARMQGLQQLAESGAPAITPASDADDSFATTMQQTIRSINQQQNVASLMMAAVDSGQSDDLVGAMVASQKAGLAFATLMRVRNKLMSGLDDIMRLPRCEDEMSELVSPAALPALSLR